jgi:hypothetical protein
MCNDTQSNHQLQQEEQQQIEQLLTADAFTKWLYENYTINNGDMLLDRYEDGCTQLKYFHDMGLPSDSEIKDL